MRPIQKVRPAPTGWRRRPGPLALAERLGRWPELVAHDFVIPFTIDLNTLNSTAHNHARIEQDGDFYALWATAAISDTSVPDQQEGYGFTGPSLSPASWWGHADIWLEGGGQRLSNSPVSVGSIFGRGGRPFVYPAPWILRAGSFVHVQLENGSSQGGAGSRVRLHWHGFKRLAGTPELPADVLLEPRLLDVLRSYSDRGQLGRVEPFFYSMFTGHDRLQSQADFIPGLSESPTITVADADFAAVYLMAEFFDEIGTPYITGFPPYDTPPILVRLVVDEGRRRLDDRAVSIGNITGHGFRWMRLPYPLLLRKGQTLSAIVTPQVRTTIANFRFLGHITIAGVRLLRGGR